MGPHIARVMVSNFPQFDFCIECVTLEINQTRILHFTIFVLRDLKNEETHGSY